LLTHDSAAVLIVTLPLVLLAGCPNKSPGSHADCGAGGPTPDAKAPSTPSTPNTPRNPLGTTCSAATECASGFCADGVCCDSACEATCYACNQQVALGNCAALASGDDPSATTACVAPSACFLPATSSVPACRFVDGTACQVDGDCMSGQCLIYYVDADGDGYGSSQTARFCGDFASSPPAGYAAYSGDCCDLDSGANPAFDSRQFLEMPDACGSFDWNCNGIVTEERTCWTGAVACGQACIFDFVYLGTTTPITLFTEACN